MSTRPFSSAWTWGRSDAMCGRVQALYPDEQVPDFQELFCCATEWRIVSSFLSFLSFPSFPQKVRGEVQNNQVEPRYVARDSPPNDWRKESCKSITSSPEPNLLSLRTLFPSNSHQYYFTNHTVSYVALTDGHKLIDCMHSGRGLIALSIAKS